MTKDKTKIDRVASAPFLDLVYPAYRVAANIIENKLSTAKIFYIGGKSMGTVSFEVPGPGTYQVTCDPRLEPLANSGTAGEVLAGKQFYSEKNAPVTGTMPNNPPQQVSVAGGESYTIPQGYHDGTGKVTGTGTVLPALTNPGTAGDLLKDKELIDQSGNVVTGTLDPVSPTYAGLLVVTVESGAVVTATDGITTLTETSTGMATFHLPNGGTWTISATLNGNQSAATEVEVQENFSLALSAGATQTVNIPTQYEAELSFIPTYTVTLTIDPTGSGTVTGAGEYQEGTRATVTANPGDGYEFAAWKEPEGSRLPTGYTELEYIQATAGFTYIDTGKTLSSKAKYVVDIEVTMKGGTSYPKFVIWAEDTTAGLLYQAGNGVQFVIRNNGTTLTNINPDPDTTVPKRHRADIDLQNGTFSLDGTIYSITVPTDFASTPSVLLLGGAHANYSLYGKLYSFENYEEGVLVQKMVPCSDPSGVIGLYDLVDGIFYANAGADTFTAGPEVSGDITVSEESEYTFTVTGDRKLVAVFAKTSRLPEGYTEVEYISNPNLTYIENLNIPGQNSNNLYSSKRFEFSVKFLDFADSSEDTITGRYYYYRPTSGSATQNNYRVYAQYA